MSDVVEIIAWWPHDTHGHPMILCGGPQCDCAIPLAGYEVGADGSVTPTVTCGYCGWKSFVRLKDWAAVKRRE
ncbi:MAG: hypothetical protein U0990_09375 [Candidatus Nanopelagicales bacterium]|nr:hypothetical protein [Candidatus Nanopelagicales bacterium]